MALLANPCEGTDGTTVTTTNSDDNGGNAFALVNINAGTICAYETTGAIHGTSSIRIQSSTAANTVQVGWTDTAATSLVVRWYENFTTLPTALQQHGFNARGNSGATSLSRMEINTNGTVRAVVSSTAGTSALALSTGVTYRFEAVVTGLNGASGACTITVYVGESTTAYTSATISGVTTSLACDTIRFGKFNGSGNVDALFDSLAADIGSTTPIGPAVQTGSVTDTVTAADTVTAVVGGVGSVSATVTAADTVSGAVGAVGAVTSTVTAGSSVVAVVGKVATVTETVTAASTVTGSAAAAGVSGEVSETVTAGSTVTATVGRVGAVTDTVTAGSSVVAAVAATGEVTQTLTAGSEVVAVVGLFGAVEATITAGSDVSVGEPPSTGQGSGRDRVTATGNDRLRTVAHAADRVRAVASASGR